MRWPFALGLLVWLIATLSLSASARGGTQTLERANELVDAGKLAYSVGEYGFAIQAFEQSHDFTQHPEMLFSIAQAHRQRHAVDARVGDAARAMVFYRRYLDALPRGAHAREAEKGIAVLAPHIPEGASVDELAAALPREAATGLAVMSPDLGATVRVDGGRARKLPLFIELPPGKHSLSLRAPGYFPEVRKIHLVRSTLQPVKVALDPKPARLAVEGPISAEVHVDGVLVGALPLTNPLRLEPGEHFVAVTMDGHAPHARTVRLLRGKVTTIHVELEVTTQRTAAWALVVSGTAGIAAGIAFGVVAVVEQRRARDLLSERSQSGILQPDDQREYDDIVAARDAYRIGSGVAAGVGFGVFLVGGALFVLDSPIVPVAGPELSGAMVHGRF